LLIDFFYL